MFTKLDKNMGLDDGMKLEMLRFIQLGLVPWLRGIRAHDEDLQLGFEVLHLVGNIWLGPNAPGATQLRWKGELESSRPEDLDLFN